MVCPFCSEEHPVTLDRCPITGQQLFDPVAVEALPAREERTPFSALLAETVGLYRRNLLVFLITASIAFVPFIGLQIGSAAMMSVRLKATQEAMRVSMQASQQQRRLSTQEQAQVQRTFTAAFADRKRFLIQL